MLGGVPMAMEELPSAEADLERLVAEERRLEEALVATHAEADELLRRAREEAAEIEEDAARRWEEHCERLRQEARERARRRSDRSIRQLERTHATLEAMEGQRLDRAARQLLQTLFPDLPGVSGPREGNGA